MLELVATGRDPDAADAVAAATGGISYVAEPDDRERPFTAMVRAVVSDPAALADAADVGLYLTFCRVIRERPDAVVPGTPSTGVTAVFPMVGHPDLSHAESDAHWRDTHAPLALRHHPGMWDYTQLSTVRTLAGPELDGFALCAFASRDDLRHRFFGDDHDRDVIVADVASFADTANSPRRVVCTETIHGTRPPTAARTWPHD